MFAESLEEDAENLARSCSRCLKVRQFEPSGETAKQFHEAHQIQLTALLGDRIGGTAVTAALSGAFAFLAALGALPIIAGVAVIGFAKGAHEA